MCLHVFVFVECMPALSPSPTSPSSLISPTSSIGSACGTHQYRSGGSNVPPPPKEAPPADVPPFRPPKPGGEESLCRIEHQNNFSHFNLFIFYLKQDLLHLHGLSKLHLHSSVPVAEFSPSGPFQGFGGSER